MGRQASWTFQRGALWTLSLNGPSVLEPVEPLLEAEMAEVRADSAGPLVTAMATADPVTVRRRFVAGRRCFGAWVEGRIASYCWVSKGEEQVGEMERRIRLETGEAYIWDCATLPPFRRQHLYTAVLAYLARRLAADGFNRLWVGANLENEPSLKAFERVGFRPVVTLTFGRLLGLYAIVTASPSEAPPELVAAARQAMALEREWTWGPLTLGRSGP